MTYPPRRVDQIVIDSLALLLQVVVDQEFLQVFSLDLVLELTY